MKLGLVSLLCAMMVPSVYAADMGMKDQPMEKPMMESTQKMDSGMKHEDKMMGDMKHDGKMMGEMKDGMKSDKMDDMHKSDMDQKSKKPMM